MFRLTREVRFGLDDDDPVDGENGHAGRPAVTGVGGRYFVVRLAIEGEPDPASGYLRNIKDLDVAVRHGAIPALRRAMSARPDQRVVRAVAGAIELPGATIVAVELSLTPFLTLGSRREDGPNVIRLSQRFEFSAAHRLHNPALSDDENVALFGKCNNPHGHGHNYELQVTIRGTPDEKTGTLMSVVALERIVDEHVIDAFDHKNLNVEVPEFLIENPSVEYIARAIYRRLSGPLAASLASVTVWETPKTWCEYSE